MLVKQLLLIYPILSLFSGTFKSTVEKQKEGNGEREQMTTKRKVTLSDSLVLRGRVAKKKKKNW